MNKKNLVLTLLTLAILLIFIFLFFFKFTKESINNEKALKEIDRLLLPVGNKSIQEQDLDKLEILVENDEHAHHEVEELKLLTKYKEYQHIGHGLVFLYEYIKTGKESICPGHELAHYYVFIDHNETYAAVRAFEDVPSSFNMWNDKMHSHNSSFRTEENYTYYKTIIEKKMEMVSNGDASHTEEEIKMLLETPCVR